LRNAPSMVLMTMSTKRQGGCDPECVLLVLFTSLPPAYSFTRDNMSTDQHLYHISDNIIIEVFI
jgi:hypothetical protein